VIAYALRYLLIGILVMLSGACTHQPLPRLHIAARTGQTDVIRTLAREGADLNQPAGVNGWTPLMHAIHKHRQASVSALLAHGADPNGTSRHGMTALAMASGYGYADIVRNLLAAGANPRQPGAASPLTAAVRGAFDIDRFAVGACQTETVKAIVTAEPELRWPRTWDGKLSLLGARLAGCVDVVRMVERLPLE
jgi:hypothetical protein